MVLAEAMAAGMLIVASASGAIPEVTAGAARLFEAGYWMGLADALGARYSGAARTARRAMRATPRSAPRRGSPPPTRPCSGALPAS